MRRLVRTTILVGTVALTLVGLQGFAAETQGFQTVNLQIEGMTCGACVKHVKAALAQVPGVSAVEFTVAKKWIFFSDYSDARVSVTFNPEKASVEMLVRAVEAAGSPLSAYKARVLTK
jgi:copper chaperone CopZ